MHLNEKPSSNSTFNQSSSSSFLLLIYCITSNGWRFNDEIDQSSKCTHSARKTTTTATKNSAGKKQSQIVLEICRILKMFQSTQQQVYKKTQKIKSNQIKIHTFTAHLLFEFPLKAEPLASCITMIEIIINIIVVATNK